MLLRRALRTDVPSLAALQQAAYAMLKARIGMSLQPADADFTAIFETMEIWVEGSAGALDAALILDVKPDHLLIWSIAVAPGRKGGRIGSALLDFAENRAQESGLGEVRLYTNERFTENVAWYQRRGYAIERIEERPDRRVVHFRKRLGSEA
ncbi:GNAT family N-acetyltransferase [Labrys okinawensis]|uniref:GNAT family N-acetyltransferase n=1 Tax=Labrys okinawensis TaxID=346911 RepID=UPI0039BD3EA0